MRFVSVQSLFRWAVSVVPVLLTAACISGALWATAPVSAQSCSWTGIWVVTGNSKFTLTQNGNQVTGSDGGNAHLSGTVSGNTLTGGWTYGSDHGAFLAQMDSSCNSFTGSEGLNGSTSVTLQTGNPFNGTRVGGTTSPSPSPSSPNGGQLQKLGGIDWNGYCQSLGGSGASLDGGTINDWHCVDASGKHVGIDSGAACQWQYQPNAIGRWDTFNDPNSWACFGSASSSPSPSSPNGGQLQKLGGIDWNGYCQSLGGSGASLDGGTINDWHCVDASGKHVGIDSGAACQWQYQPNAIGRWDTFNDPNSWACFGSASSSPSPSPSPAPARRRQTRRALIGAPARRTTPRTSASSSRTSVRRAEARITSGEPIPTPMTRRSARRRCTRD